MSRILPITFVLVAAVACASVRGQQWIDPAGGAFGDPGNWSSAQVPDNLAHVRFSLNKTYTVTFDRDYSMLTLRVSPGDVTFDLGGFTYSLFFGEGSIIMGDFRDQRGSLRITNGTLRGFVATAIASAPGTHAVLEVLGTGAVFDASGIFGSLIVGFNGHGELHVNAGGRVLTRNAIISAEVSGLARLRGAGSTWINQTTLRLGPEGQGVLSLGAGTTVTTGSYTQNPGSTLQIEIEAAAAGAGFGSLTVTGAADLAGTLDVALLNGFTPTPTAVFTIVSATTLNGGFANAVPSGGVAALTLPQGVFRVTYTASAVVLSDFVRFCAADFDSDGDVDESDLAVLLSNFGLASGGTRQTGDADGDGAVNETDLGTLLSEFGSACPA